MAVSLATTVTATPDCHAERSEASPSRTLSTLRELLRSRCCLSGTYGDAKGNLTSDGVRSYTYDHANRLAQVTEGSLTTQFAYNGDGVRTSKTVAGDATEYVLDLMATLPVVISDTEAVYLDGLDIIAQQEIPPRTACGQVQPGRASGVAAGQGIEDWPEPVRRRCGSSTAPRP